MKEIYLDNSATTVLSERVKARMRDAMEQYGNPSSLHPLGNRAHECLENARRQVREGLGLRRSDSDEVIFTSCGSEADNLALLGCAYAKPRRKGMKIISTDSEHAAVENTLRRLESDGFQVARIRTVGGVLDMEQYQKELDSRVFLVSMMAVNNETGAAYDLQTAFSMAKSVNPDIVTHTDAVQAFLKLPFSPKRIGADLVTISAHKIHGPKGVGALYASVAAMRRRDFVPWLLGGGQEGGFRSGTENTVGIAGFAEAVQEGHALLSEDISRMDDLRTYAIKKLSALPVRLNLPLGACAPHILNLTLPDIRSETMLHSLSRQGIYVSNGSACSSHSKHPSSALMAFGLTEAETESSIRISFSKYNTKDDVDALVSALQDSIQQLVRVRSR